MIMDYNVRTDLALEEQERFESDNVEVSGVILDEKVDEEKELKVTRVIIETENGAKIMGKPVGTYLTIESPNLSVPDEELQDQIAEEVKSYLKPMIQKYVRKGDNLSVLVVGLGNRESTPDSLGPLVVDRLIVTRHIVREYGTYAMGLTNTNLVSAMVPGVMGQTGMESTEMVKGVVRETHPGLVIAVDALAARNSRRLNRTIQIADTGIHPGAGVGNYRNGLTRDTLGVPVIGIGIPTVVDAATIVNDTMDQLIREIESSSTFVSARKIMRDYNEGEKQELIKEMISPNLMGMFVTPKDIDEIMIQTSSILAMALNKLFREELQIGDRKC